STLRYDTRSLELLPKPSSTNMSIPSADSGPAIGAPSQLKHVMLWNAMRSTAYLARCARARKSPPRSASLVRSQNAAARPRHALVARQEVGEHFQREARRVRNRLVIDADGDLQVGPRARDR